MAVLSLLYKYFLELLYYICCIIMNTIKIVVVDVGLYENVGMGIWDLWGKKIKSSCHRGLTSFRNIQML